MFVMLTKFMINIGPPSSLKLSRPLQTSVVPPYVVVVTEPVDVDCVSGVGVGVGEGIF